MTMISYRTTFYTSVVLKYSFQNVTYISEKINNYLEIGKDYRGTAGFSKAKVARFWMG